MVGAGFKPALSVYNPIPTPTATRHFKDFGPLVQLDSRHSWFRLNIWRKDAYSSKLVNLPMLRDIAEPLGT